MPYSVHVRICLVGGWSVGPFCAGKKESNDNVNDDRPLRFQSRGHKQTKGVAKAETVAPNTIAPAVC